MYIHTCIYLYTYIYSQMYTHIYICIWEDEHTRRMIFTYFYPSAILKSQFYSLFAQPI